jgi:hypothetical protein
VLAVPSGDAKDERDGGLVFFRRGFDEKAALKGWGGLEFVYAKADAEKLIQQSGQTVMAADPAADKLPVKMGHDDMKAVTLWALSPKQVTADNHGVGLTAVKYASAGDSSATAALPVATPVVSDKAKAGHALPKKLPKTASNNYLYLLCGTVLFGLGGCIRTLRARQGSIL